MLSSVPRRGGPMTHKSALVLPLVTLCVLLVSCGPPKPGAPTASIQTAPAPPTPTAEPRPSAYPTPDLSRRPLVWFGPLPPLRIHEGRPFTGSLDFMQLFQTDAPWEKAAARVQVFKLFGEWVSESASDAELKQVFANLRRRGIAVNVDAGPLTPSSDCGQAVEGFAGVQEGLRIARRV